MFKSIFLIVVVLLFAFVASTSLIPRVDKMSLTPFNDFFHEFALFPSKNVTWPVVEKDLTKDLVPIMSTDLIEGTDNYSVNVDLPGVDPKDLDVTLDDKVLVISAERKHVHEEKTDKVHSMERSFGKVQRKIRLPNNADLDKVDTNFKNGVLSIIFPKKTGPDTSVRKIKINIDENTEKVQAIPDL